MDVTEADAEALADGGLQWLLRESRDDGDGLAWPETPGDDAVDYSLYCGSAGAVLALVEAYRHFGDERYARAAVRGGLALAASVGEEEDSSLYFGLAGIAWVLAALAAEFGEAEFERSAARGFSLVRSRFDGERWGADVELLAGNAGIALGALAARDPDLAVSAVTPYLRTAEVTGHGVQWEVRAGEKSRLHHISHGTLGIVAALAMVGHEASRGDLVELALDGAADVVARNEAGPDEFLVPHSDPQFMPERVERYSYGWCHGPAGDAQAFRILRRATGDDSWASLARRCWSTVTHSGLPERTRPGFWDNNGHCCGTAGVLALACDRAVETGDGQEFADVLVRDLATRATVTGGRISWSNCEHRVTPGNLPPQTGWAAGNAGIIRELLRYARLSQGRDPGYAVSWPDHLAAAR